MLRTCGERSQLMTPMPITGGKLENGNTYIVLFAKLLAEGRAHDVAADARRGTIMGLSRLSPGRVEDWTCVVSKTAISDTW